jgi:hypothetical protein
VLYALTLRQTERESEREGERERPAACKRIMSETEFSSGYKIKH